MSCNSSGMQLLIFVCAPDWHCRLSWTSRCLHVELVHTNINISFPARTFGEHPRANLLRLSWQKRPSPTRPFLPSACLLSKHWLHLSALSLTVTRGLYTGTKLRLCNLWEWELSLPNTSEFACALVQWWFASKRILEKFLLLHWLGHRRHQWLGSHHPLGDRERRPSWSSLPKAHTFQKNRVSASQSFCPLAVALLHAPSGSEPNPQIGMQLSSETGVSSQWWHCSHDANCKSCSQLSLKQALFQTQLCRRARRAGWLIAPHHRSR